MMKFKLHQKVLFVEDEGISKGEIIHITIGISPAGKSVVYTVESEDIIGHYFESELYDNTLEGIEKLKKECSN